MSSPGPLWTETGRWLLTLVVAAVLLLAMLWLGMLDHGPVLNVAIVLGGAVLATAAYRAIRTLAGWSEPAHWFVTLRDSSTTPPVLDFRVIRLHRDLTDTLQGERPQDRTRATLAGLARQRLLRVHGIDPDTDPDAAGQVLGEAATRYLAGPGFDGPDTGAPAPGPTHHRPTARELDRLVRGLEEIT